MAEQVEATRGSNQSIGATTKPYRSRKPDILKPAVTKKILFIVILAWLTQITVWTGYNLKNVNGGYSTFAEVREVAREIVREEIERHAADGLGRVDYALATGGGYVTKHSQANSVGSVWFTRIGRNGVHVDSVKMLRPSFGEPGDCFVLNGSSGFVEIKLGKAIVPQAVTLEHVAKSVAYDRSSAPKDCRVSGWSGEKETDVPDNTEKMIPLGEFTYDLEKSSAQTFDVSLPEDGGIGVVDTIRLDFTSNHGSATHTSIYRFRVHGQDPDSSVPLANSFFSNLKNLIL